MNNVTRFVRAPRPTHYCLRQGHFGTYRPSCRSPLVRNRHDRSDLHYRSSLTLHRLQWKFPGSSCSLFVSHFPCGVEERGNLTGCRWFDHVRIKRDEMLDSLNILRDVAVQLGANDSRYHCPQHPDTRTNARGFEPGWLIRWMDSSVLMLL